MPIVRTEGTQVHYRTEGTGPGLLLVHGSTADSEANFAALRPYFTDRRTVVTADYSGSGSTPLPAGGELGIDLLSNQMAAAARAATDGPVDVVGVSLGAVLAAALAAEHPGLVRRLVLVGGWARNDDPRQRLMFGLWRTLADLDRDAYQRFITLLALSPETLSGLDDDTIATLAAAAEPSEGARRQIDLDLVADIRGRLAEIRAPTLVIGATQDQVVPVAHARELHAGIGGSRYEEIDSGHNVLYERGKELADLITEFLD